MEVNFLDYVVHPLWEQLVQVYSYDEGGEATEPSFMIRDKCQRRDWKGEVLNKEL
jgi:hypothetical protein